MEVKITGHFTGSAIEKMSRVVKAAQAAGFDCLRIYTKTCGEGVAVEHMATRDGQDVMKSYRFVYSDRPHAEVDEYVTEAVKQFDSMSEGEPEEAGWR